ncbi:hypothetical protein NMC70_05120 [Enterococcus faecium]|uniref:hypothetical protein n=1 Tax=Enterococcus faecium TaxID=1352 RepID=UPI001C915160|nr:hypothetical protein [Enterococcus faecium]MBY3650114.1 hypothetical protein [Enterococcus faecium]MBY7575190.1 hypothetical protein [Enterococcus faecium]MCX3902215.1 hypothetical protein [Enterococcus faecium]UNS61648.1 hypothetical protein MPL11_08525 [Enterococcus faecium]
MIGLTIFWCAIGGLLAFLGYYLICESRKGRKYTVTGIVLLIIGIYLVYALLSQTDDKEDDNNDEMKF